MKEVHQIQTVAEMIDCGESVGRALLGGETIALNGDLGAGKTHFCKGIAKGVGASESVSSPTFSLVNEYRSGRIPVFHFDFYRLESAEELLQIGWEDYLDEEGIVLVEWAEKFPEVLPEETRNCQFEILDESTRSLTWS